MSKKRSTSRAPTGKSDRGGEERETSDVAADRDVCDECGEVHPGCKAHTKNGPNKGRPCGAHIRKGSVGVCPKHGGNHPSHKRKAKERLLELVDPALASLHKVLTDPRADDSTKVRAALGILDRTGHGPGAKIAIGVDDKFGALLDAAYGDGAVDRELNDGTKPALPSGGGGQGVGTWEDHEQASSDAQADAWREYDDEEAAEYEARPIFRNENTVRGEVVEDSIIPGPPDTRDAPSEHDPLGWPYRREPG